MSGGKRRSPVTQCSPTIRARTRRCPCPWILSSFDFIAAPRPIAVELPAGQLGELLQAAELAQGRDGRERRRGCRTGVSAYNHEAATQTHAAVLIGRRAVSGWQ